METSDGRSVAWRAVVPASIGVFLAGVLLAAFMHAPALVYHGVFKSDIKQSPHWGAYHTSSFQPGDLVLRYASFNESPLQNVIYWLATWFADYVTLTKILAIASYGALALTFFLVGRAMYGLRFGLLLSLFIIVFPNQWEFSAGFFSKFWAIPLLLICVFLLQSDRPRGLIWLMPLAALAYPMVSVLIGMTAAVHWLLGLAARCPGNRELFRSLAIGSVLAVALLMTKYAAPPEWIGPMRPGAELRQMPELGPDGYPSRYIPIPSIGSELMNYVGNPLVVFSAAVFLLALGRNVAWERSWAAMFIASVIGYVLADYFFLRLYIPNRYTRYSIAAILALWHARNWMLVLARAKRTSARLGLVVALLAVGGYSHVSPESGDRLADSRELVPVCRFIREELPERILLGGSPKALDSVMVLARRSVLAPYKLAHPWFTNYYDEIRERTRATLRAHFAGDPGPLNELHRRYGATHFLVDKELLRDVRTGKRIIASPYNEEVYAELGDRRTFYLASWTPLWLWEDENYAVVPLPIPVTEAGETD